MLTTILEVLAVLAVLFVAAAVATRDDPILADAPADDPDVGLPPGPLQPEDIGRVKFGLALRGYRMREVDAVLTRVAHEIADRDTRLLALEQALVDVVEPQVAEAEHAHAHASGTIEQARHSEERDTAAVRLYKEPQPADPLPEPEAATPEPGAAAHHEPADVSAETPAPADLPVVAAEPPAPSDPSPRPDPVALPMWSPSSAISVTPAAPETPAAAAPDTPAAAAPDTPAAAAPDTPATAAPDTPTAAAPDTPAAAVPAEGLPLWPQPEMEAEPEPMAFPEIHSGGEDPQDH